MNARPLSCDRSRDSKFDVSLHAAKFANGIDGAIEFNCDLFDYITTERIAARVQSMAAEFADRLFRTLMSGGCSSCLSTRLIACSGASMTQLHRSLGIYASEKRWRRNRRACRPP